MAQISMEDAFPTFQKRCTELFEANLLLQAHVDVLERQLAAALEGNGQAPEGAQQPTPSGSEPEPGLGAAPAEETPHGDHANFDQQDDLERRHG